MSALICKDVFVLHMSWGEVYVYQCQCKSLFIGMYLYARAFVALCICVCESTYIYMSACVHGLCHVSLLCVGPLIGLGH